MYFKTLEKNMMKTFNILSLWVEKRQNSMKAYDWFVGKCFTESGDCR